MEYSRVIRIETVRTCPIIVGANLIDDLGECFDFSGYSSIVLITDARVNKLYGQSVTAALQTTGKRISALTLPVGERTKSLRVAERGYRFLLEHNTDRQGLICTLGGGVVGDLGGYLAATYLRGVDYIQLPTTFLAQIDSSIGGKVGVNFGGKKNMVGSFYQPRAIIADVSFLKSLTPAEMRNGLAEAIKYGLAMDTALLQMMERQANEFTTAELVDIVRRCSALKAGIVEADETERSGQRAILNFGHTIGHAVEAVTGLQVRSHGEAVAIGMMAAARISEQAGMLDSNSRQRIEKVLRKYGLPISCREASPDDLLSAIHFDKKTTAGQTAWVLLRGIGNGVVNQHVTDNMVKDVLKEICR
ncbi:MAG TPA: 3-dehydroquinate synthase [Dehalococcoidia bacterium]|nr:3-dehydroquinate synthase [Dehalococcoidia bacterium]